MSLSRSVGMLSPELLPVRLIAFRTGRVKALPDDGGPLRIGQYELRFHVGEYVAGSSLVVADPPYLDVIPLRIGDTYTTYRGS